MKRVLDKSGQIEELGVQPQNILAAIPGYTYVFNGNLEYIYVSSQGARVFGLEPQDMIGKTWQEL